ncbi:hypothetical protein OUZ56_020940 [Daphnia magna]|uniref:Uncharacterized protein n=2 Tax=Daphnia magna TaxID=35525 RepID=A0ABQ9ZGL6_9CRUS|nr:hypothetical protein OUZ56_020940 [Daphnia magna]
MFSLSTALFLLLAFFQSSQCTDINNDSTVMETVGDDSLDKAATIVAESMVSTEDGQGKPSALSLDGKATRSRYFKSFGGAGDPNLSIYSFGLGKRTSRSNSINPYSFGLGKREGGNVKNYPQNPYSFGLGKRNPMYNFGLGKRADRDNDAWKRNANRFGFGLGKRNLKDEDLSQWLNDEGYSQFDDTEEDVEVEEKEDDSHEYMEANKRSSGITNGQAFFPSHLQTAFYGGPLLPTLVRSNQMATSGLGKSRTFNQQAANEIPNLGKRLPVYNFGLGK